MQKRHKVSQGAKGFGSKWVQIPIPDPEVYNITEQRKKKGTIFAIDQRIDSIYKLSAHSKLWNSRIEGFVNLNTRTGTSVSAIDEARGSDVSPPAYKKRANSKSVIMLGQYTMKVSKMLSFEWVDHDAACESDGDDEIVIMQSDSNTVFDRLLKWKSTINDEDSSALETLLSMGERYSRPEGTL